MPDKTYDNIRHPELLGGLIGHRLVDVTQTDREAIADEGSRVHLHFDDGTTVSFPVDDDHGFDIETV